MPRQDVPYGGAICRLKERIAEIWDKLGEKLHSINGVEGDGAGDVKIVSGDAAVVINNDQIGHKIEVGLDKSKLPSAAVSSVNGQTGAVALDAGDIPTHGNSDVQTDIDVGKAGLKNCIANIITEREERQNADAALQTNINAARASIPEMSIVPDPYKGIERDAQGRAFAADPASGATDKTLVTANWVSQTGDSGPNNLIHRSGTETKNGRLDVITPSLTRVRPNIGKSPQNYANKFYKLFTINKGTVILVDFEVITNGGFMRCIYDMRSNGLSHAYVSIIGDRFATDKAVITTEKDNVYTVWLQNPQNRGFAITVKNLYNLFTNMAVYDIGDSMLNWIYDGTPEDEPAAADYDTIKYSEAFT